MMTNYTEFQYEDTDAIVATILTNKQPLTYEDIINSVGCEMNSYEKKFALLMIQLGFVVYREIDIDGFGRTADFFVINPFSRQGMLIELTLMDDKETGVGRKTKLRKERQVKALEGRGIPYVILYREDLNVIRHFLDPNLF
jgi:hypothetical protein